MGVKRASTRIDPALLEQAALLRLGGRTLEEIRATTGISLAALSTNLRKDPRFAEGASAASIEDEEARADLWATAREATRALRAICRNVTERARAGEGDGLERAASGIASALEKATKLARLLDGKPTSHTKSESAASEPTDDEQRLLDLADRAELG